MEGKPSWVDFMMQGVSPQVRVRLVACTAFVLVIYGYAFCLGLTPWFKGFAKSEQLDGVVADIKELRISQIESSLLELRSSQCHLPTNSPAKSVYAANITQRMAVYAQLSGQQFNLPECTDE